MNLNKKNIFYLNYAHLLNLLLDFDIMNIIVVLAWSDHFAKKNALTLESSNMKFSMCWSLSVEFISETI